MMEIVEVGTKDLVEIKIEPACVGKFNQYELDHDCFEFVDCMEAYGTVNTIQETNFDPLADFQVKIEDKKGCEDVIHQQIMLVDPACKKHSTAAANCLGTSVALDPLCITQSQNALSNLANDVENENSKAYKVTGDQENRENEALFIERFPLSGLKNIYHRVATFNETLQITIQAQTNENEKMYKCNQCSYKSIRKANLKSHMLKHTNEKKYKCTMCNYRTAYNQCFTTHSAAHRGEKKYNCTECSFKTAYSNFLKLHLARHRGETKFSCPECCYKTLYKQCLVNHIANVHRNEKKFSCLKCNFRTAYRCSLKMHLVKHKHERKCFTYYCANCNYATPFHQLLEAHLRQVCRIPNEETSEPWYYRTFEDSTAEDI